MRQHAVRLMMLGCLGAPKNCRHGRYPKPQCNALVSEKFLIVLVTIIEETATATCFTWFAFA